MKTPEHWSEGYGFVAGMKELVEAIQTDARADLLTENAELKATVDKLFEYTRHGPSCPMPMRACDCGLRELLDHIEKGKP